MMARILRMSAAMLVPVVPPAVAQAPAGTGDHTVRNDAPYQRRKPDRHDVRGTDPESRANDRDGDEKSKPA